MLYRLLGMVVWNGGKFVLRQKYARTHFPKPVVAGAVLVLVGAVVLIPLGEVTRIYLGGTGKALDLVIYGALIMIVSVVQPAGLVGIARRFRRAA